MNWQLFVLKQLGIIVEKKLVGVFHPAETYYIVKLDHFPKFRGEHKNIYEATTRMIWPNDSISPT